MYLIDNLGWFSHARRCPSDNFNPRPDINDISLLVIHNISLPPGQFGTGCVQAFFCNELDCYSHPQLEELTGVQVSAHLFIDRNGDCFQFVRFLPPLSKKCDYLVLCVPPNLLRIFQEGLKSFPVCSTNDIKPGADFHVLLMDLPHLLGIADPSTPIPYLDVREDRVERWANRLPIKMLKVGLCWQGSRGYEMDYLRSIPFSALTPLIENSLANFVAIQKEYATETIPRMSKLLDLGPDLDNVDSFIDTAAVIMDLDLIITSDTALAHLAGALGKPVWVLLNSAPDWRWQLKSENTHWYQTMRLFRQTTPGDWTTVITDVQKALNNFQRK